MRAAPSAIDAAGRIVGQMRIGGMALHAAHRDDARQRAAAADLDHVAERVGVGRLADQRGIPALALAGRPFEQLRRAVDGGSLLVAGDQQRDRALRPPMAPDMAGDRRDEAGDAALHVDGAAAVHLAIVDVGGEGRVAPGRLVAGRHHVGVAGEHQVRPVAREPGIAGSQRPACPLRKKPGARRKNPAASA